MKNASLRSGIVLILVMLASALAGADDLVAPPSPSVVAVPPVSTWLPQVEAAAAAHEVSARALAAVRERALTAIAASERHGSPWLLAVALGSILALGLSALWTRLAGPRPRALTRTGLAVDVVADRRSRTTVIMLSDPRRVAAATAPDRARVAAVRAAAALAEDEQPADPSYVRSTTTRIAHKHETRQWHLRQRARIVAAKQAGGARPTVLRRA